MNYKLHFLQNGRELVATCDSEKDALERARALAADDVLYIEIPGGNITKVVILEWCRNNPPLGTAVPGRPAT